jgi:NAD(P)-dependent dehydrogenase (short-subunit alcohol dehydrogenase family)
LSVTGKVALVTGGASGLGRASVLEFLRQGAAGVMIADRDAASAQAVIEAAPALGVDGEVAFVETDVTDPEAVGRMVAATVDRFGRLDCAVNNAGTTGATAATAQYPLDEWERVLRVNLTSVLLCLQAEVPIMLEQGGGSIVNVASGAGRVGFPGLAAYVASKHGVVGLTRTAALEYARAGIRVNAVCPGSTRTPMLETFMGGDPGIEKLMSRASPMGRLGRPEEIASAIVWLSSDGASFTNGQAIAVDGGAVMQ